MVVQCPYDWVGLRVTLLELETEICMSAVLMTLDDLVSALAGLEEP